MNALDYAERIAYSSKETLRFTYDMAVRYKDSPGVFVECGVAAGAQVIAMAYGAPNKQVIAFDSFEGIPLPSNRDDQMPGIMMLTETERRLLPDPGKQKLETTGATSVSLEDFWDNIENAFGEKSRSAIQSIEPIKGWFEETLPLVNELRYNHIFYIENGISLLRLDGDLYNSTWVCLQHLFPKVVSGGCVIIDDWHLPGCQAACVEYFELIGYQPEWKFISDIAYFEKK